MTIKILASGSSGNCYKISDEATALLIECGIPMKDIKKECNYQLNDIVACLVSHSHMDHCKAAKEIMRAGIDIYFTEPTKEALKLSGHRLNVLEMKNQVRIGTFIVKAFETEHDCPGSIGFLIQSINTGERLVYLSDTYYSRYVFPGLNYILVEANYITEILYENIQAGLIPELLKNRLLKSHFSLEHCKKFLKANDLSQCKKIILIHLSEGNSDAARMIQEVEELTGINTIVAEPGLEVELELYPY